MIYGKMHKIIDFFYLIKFIIFSFIKKENKKTINLNYGNANHSKDGYFTGGRVKLKILEKIYKQNENFDFLYLVSSSLPNYVKLYIFITKLLKKKIILNQNGVAYPAWSNKYIKINNRLRYIYDKSDFVIFQSNFCKISAEKWLSNKKKKFKVIYNPVILKKKNIIKNLKLFNLIVSGSHENKERVLLALNVLTLLIDQKENFRLIIAGPLIWPNAKSEVKNLINLNGLKKRVDIIGKYHQHNLKKIYKKNSILLHLKYNDPSPTVPIEAQSYGLPVICSNSGGMPELLSKKSSIILNVRKNWKKNYYPSIEILSKAILKIKKNYKAYSVESYKNSKKYDFQSWIKKHEDLFNSLR